MEGDDYEDEDQEGMLPKLNVNEVLEMTISMQQKDIQKHLIDIRRHLWFENLKNLGSADLLLMHQQFLLFKEENMLKKVQSREKIEIIHELTLGEGSNSFENTN